jgi:septum formation protein
VYTGVCITSPPSPLLKERGATAKCLVVSTKVFFKKLTAKEINFYVTNYKPFDKAGAYGAQEWIGYVGVEKIVGSYFNVMGLPVKELYKELSKYR